jgi:hypothetical protein
MKKAQTENITDYFNDRLMQVINPGPLRGPVKKLSLRRNKKGDLILATISDGWHKEDRQGRPAGTVFQSTDTIEFRHLGGARAIASGVVPYSYRSQGSVGKQAETTEKSSVQSIALDFHRGEQSAFLIEWVDNIATNFIWPDLLNQHSIEKFTETLGSQGNQLTIFGSEEEKSGGRGAMHLTIAGIELFLAKGKTKGRKKRLGRIIYGACPSQEIRDKVRECLSFALGLPIVYYGHTEFCANWIPTRTRSVDALSIAGGVFALHEQPPFPICDSKYGRVLDGLLVSAVTNSIFDKYDELKFRELSFAYWHAVCAPAHIAAAHFGALIEQFQRASSDEAIRASRKGILDDGLWKDLREKIKITLDAATIPEELMPILRNKMEGLNQAPQSVMLRRLLDRLGLKVGDVETKALKRRNKAAHGHLSRDHLEIILNNTTLRVLFHRMLGGVTHCSASYVDYYSLNFPTRALSNPIPARP